MQSAGLWSSQAVRSFSDTDTAGSPDTTCHGPELCPFEPLYLEPQCILGVKEDILPLFFFFVNSFLQIAAKQYFQNFPGSPVVKTPSFQYRRCGFNPWSGN